MKPLLLLLDCPAFSFRVRAAVVRLGESEAAVKTVGGVVSGGNPYEVLAAQNTLDCRRRAGHVTLAEANRLVSGGKSHEPFYGIPRYLVALP